MPVLIDQSGKPVHVPAQPERIVSLVPSLTELLYHLGLEDRVAGITKFCVHPEKWFRSKLRVGGTKSVRLDVIQHIRPDLIIANKEENTREQIETLSRQFPVWVTEVKNLNGALETILQLGNITGTGEKAVDIVHSIRHAFQQYLPSPPALPFLNSCYLIWRNPLMTVGGDTFIHDMMRRCGLQNIFGETARYPELTIEALQQKNCELLLLSSEPFPFKESHMAEFSSRLPGTKIVLADGEMFSWYGSRLMEAPAYFADLLQQIGRLR